MGGFRDGPLFQVICWTIPLLFFLFPLSAWSCESNLNPLAFQAQTFTQNTLLPNGMMAIRYPGTKQETVPHVSVHRVIMTVPGLQNALPEATDEHYRIVEVDGTVGWVTYLLAAHALFYGMGQDGLGFPEKMWVDPKEDGLNGNEHLNGRAD